MRIRKLWDDLQSSLWFRPALWVSALGMLAIGLIAIDRGIVRPGTPIVIPWLFSGGADGARTMLSAVSTTLLTVTTLAFSIMMVAVVQTANAYSPRILRQYLADTANQNVLGILIGTFLFSLLVLRAVRVTDEFTFVPALSVTVAILLSLLSIAAFIYFIHHVAHSIEVSHIVKMLVAEAAEILPAHFPSGVGRGWRGEGEPPLPDTPGALVTARGSGYIQFIAPAELLATARRADAIVRLEIATGDYVVPGIPLATIWPASAVEDETVADAVRGAFQLGQERTLVQDIHFALRQLSDIALRALSPAVNDPSTAINCIDAMATVLARFASLPLPSPYRCDEEGSLRLIAPGPTLATMLDHAFSQVRRYGAGDLVCALRLIEVCGHLGYVATAPEARAALWHHACMTARAALATLREPADRAEISQRLRQSGAILGHDPEPLRLADL